MDSRSIVKKMKEEENNNQDHMLRLKARNDEYQVVIHNLTNAENQNQNTKLHMDTLDAKIASLRKQLN